jgi:MSHA biogenesis protein MshF
MLHGVFDRLQFERLKGFIWSALILLLIAALLGKWSQLNERMEETKIKLTVGNFYNNAVSLRNLWELNNKPNYITVDNIDLSFTELGWPIVLESRQINCEKMWSLLSGDQLVSSYISLSNKKTVNSSGYNSCEYQIIDGKGLELSYEHETIHIDSFLTQITM